MNYQPLPHWPQSARELRAQHSDMMAAMRRAQGHHETAEAWERHAAALRTPVQTSIADFVERRHG